MSGRTNQPRRYFFRDEVRSLCSIARMVGMDPGTLYARVVLCGMTLDDAIAQPVRPRRDKRGAPA